jgi:cell division transport system permease protein
MRSWIAQHAAAAADAARRAVSNLFGTALNALAIGTALSLPLALYLTLDQLGGVAQRISPAPQLSVFLALDAKADVVREAQRRLRAHPLVETVRYVPRDAALAQLERTAGLAEVEQTLGRNPLPDALVASLRVETPDRIEALRVEASTWPGVDQVQADTQWALRLQALLALGRAVVTLLGVMFGAALVAITFNTIRLQILTRQEEIEVSKLIGATDAFVRRPFVYFGLLQGLLGGAVALAVVGVAFWALNREIGAFASLYAAAFRLVGPDLGQAGGLLAGAALLGAAGALMSVRRHLKNIR